MYDPEKNNGSTPKHTAGLLYREVAIVGKNMSQNFALRNAQGHRVFPYLLRDLMVERPSQVWGIELTSSEVLRLLRFKLT